MGGLPIYWITGNMEFQKVGLLSGWMNGIMQLFEGCNYMTWGFLREGLPTGWITKDMEFQRNAIPIGWVTGEIKLVKEGCKSKSNKAGILRDGLSTCWITENMGF